MNISEKKATKLIKPKGPQDSQWGELVSAISEFGISNFGIWYQQFRNLVSAKPKKMEPQWPRAPGPLQILYMQCQKHVNWHQQGISNFGIWYQRYHKLAHFLWPECGWPWARTWGFGISNFGFWYQQYNKYHRHDTCFWLLGKNMCHACVG